MSFEGYGWYLSGTAALLYTSYYVHNIVAWLKIRSFFNGRSLAGPRTSKIVSITYVTTLALAAPPNIFQIFNNFRYFNNISMLYAKVRPYEPLFRDPWWVFSCIVFFHAIRSSFNLHPIHLMKRSPRFAILLIAMILALGFTVVDILSTLVPALSETDGINPYWKLALVFKCLTDNIMLDDFKSVLTRLGGVRLDGDGRDIRTDILGPSRGRSGEDPYYTTDSASSARDPLQSHDSSSQSKHRRYRFGSRRPRRDEHSAVEVVNLSSGGRKIEIAEKLGRSSIDSDTGAGVETTNRSPFGLDNEMISVGVLPGINDYGYGLPVRNNATSHLTHIKPLPSITGDDQSPSDFEKRNRHTSNFSVPPSFPNHTMKLPNVNDIGFPVNPDDANTTSSRGHTLSGSVISADGTAPWERIQFATSALITDTNEEDDGETGSRRQLTGQAGSETEDEARHQHRISR